MRNYGLEKMKRMTLEDIALKKKISLSWAKTIHKKSLRKLAKIRGDFLAFELNNNNNTEQIHIRTATSD